MSAIKLPVIPPDELTRPIEQRPANWRKPDVNVRALEAELHAAGIEGEVRFDAGTKALYSADASNYRQVPIGVVIPKSNEDVMRAVEVCRRNGAPLLSRGGGTSLAGQCCNYALVIDWSKYLNNILELNPYEKWCRVQPGVIADQVRKAGAKYRLTYAPQPATHNRCVFGGMLGNNSCGVHAQMHGAAVNNVEEMDVLLYDGTRMNVGWTSDPEMEEKIRKGGREGDIYRKLKALRERYAGLIEKRYPSIPRRISGYNLDQLIPNPKDGRFNIARALVGTEGTCVAMLEAKVTLVYNHPQRVLLVVGYKDVYECGDHIPDILPFGPIGLEGLDERLIKNVEIKGGPHRKYLPMLPDGKGWLMVEFGADTKEEAKEQARKLKEALQNSSHPPVGIELIDDDGKQGHIWDIRESGLGATAFVPGQNDAWPGWEDSAVPPDKVGPYLRDLCSLWEKYGYSAAMYGHFGQGCIHCRIDFDVTTEPGIKKFRSYMEDAADLVVRYGGSLSGEHGDGQARAELLPKMFGEELVQAFREFKSIWDPDWKMNPGKVVDPYRLDENLRLGALYNPWDPPTYFKFPDDGGSFAHAALRCVGVGLCRRHSSDKEENNTMCPSYMVTHEEKHTTRGRAHALWEMMNGNVVSNGWRDDHVKETLDLCLSCKGCKGDCPVNVDIATYKAEFLAHYWEGRLRPRYAYAFGWIDKWSRLASIAPGFVNLFTQLPGLSLIAKKATGMPRQREIPAFAPETFKSWYSKRGPRVHSGRKVVLFPDTFNNFFFPETAQAAVEVLEAAGYEVEVPQAHVCCGRPLYDYGFMKMAINYLDRNLAVLQPQIEQETPMVVLEPSCCSVFRDELNELMPDRKDAKKLVANTFTLSEFLEKKADFKPPVMEREAIVQGHCHHKAIMRMDDEQQVWKKMKLNAELLTSGCCGMAGSFGYEADKYDVSIACGERELLPRVRKTGLRTLIVADGFSCKEQIAQDTDRHALHMAEVIQLAMRHGKHGPPGLYPEDDVVKTRHKAIKRSMLRAGIAAGAVLAGVVGLALWRTSSEK